MSDPNREDGPAGKARRGRNLLLALALGAFVIVVFIVTLVKLGAHGPPAF
ncbi:MAG: hypothetical protein ACR2FH_05805 [Caulobacteraceae bacterium]